MTSGCDELQGYLYGKPMSADQFIRFVQELDALLDEAGGLVSGEKEQFASAYR